jgi:hypothetical protein
VTAAEVASSVSRVGQHDTGAAVRIEHIGSLGIGLSGAAEGGQQVEPARLEPVGCQGLGEGGVGQVRSPEQAPQQDERGQVEVGPLPPPRLDDRST